MRLVRPPGGVYVHLCFWICVKSNQKYVTSFQLRHFSLIENLKKKQFYALCILA